jgi:hypothetical protein
MVKKYFKVKVVSKSLEKVGYIKFFNSLPGFIKVHIEVSR